MKKHIIRRQNGKKITFIGVNHEKSLENDEINTIIESNNKILLEEDTTLKYNDLIKKFQTGKVYEETSKNIYNKLVFQKKLNKISGWDIRPNYLQHTQTGLYGADKNKKPFFLMHTMKQVNDFFIKKIPNGNNKYKVFLDFSKKIKDDKLDNLIINKKVNPRFIEELHNELRKDHADIADDYVIKKVLPKYENEDITIIVGSNHFNNMINNFNIKQIDKKANLIFYTFFSI